MKRQFTQENITELTENEIFVFGSNLNGNHAGGAAKIAIDKFGAIEGEAEGLFGQSYAIPTLGADMEKLPLCEISNSIDRLYKYADENADLVFWVTKIGCGIAGFEEKEIVQLFKEKETPFNVYLPQEFSLVKGVKAFDKGLNCRGFHFEENKEFFQDGEIETCTNGFHFCENPFDTLKYYNAYDSDFAKVEGFGIIDNKNDKYAVSNLIVKEKINIGMFIKLGLEFTNKKVEFLRKRAEKLIQKNTLNSSVNSGLDYSVNSGLDSSVNSGLDYSINSGLDYSINSGLDYSVNSGLDSSINSGHNSSVNSGLDYSVNSGLDSSVNSGLDSSVNSGLDYSVCVGRHNSTINLNGINSFGIAGKGSKIKGKIGNAICLVEFGNNHNIINVKSAIIDGEILKEDTYYSLINGEFTEVTD